MSITRKRRFLICYDIADPKRLVRMHRLLSKHALPVQYSVFMMHTHVLKLESLLGELETIIKQTEDDVRVYTLSDQHAPIVSGRAIMPDGLALIDSQADLFQNRAA